MIVVDSSVWIGHSRGLNTDAVGKLQDLVADLDGGVLIGDLILLEVLQGARNEASAALIERNLGAFPIVRMLDTDLAVTAARNYRALRARGITVRKTNDMLIGTYCLENGHHLLHDDRDFDPMVEYLGLSAW